MEMSSLLALDANDRAIGDLVPSGMWLEFGVARSPVT
jgi:hypothetical protein